MSDKDAISRKKFLTKMGQVGLTSIAGLALGGLTSPSAAATPAAEPNAKAPRLAFNLALAGTLDPAMEKPVGVAIDREDRLYVAAKSGVKLFDREGRLVRELKVSGPACCVAVDPEGFCYVGRRTRIEKFDGEGKPIIAWGQRGFEPGDFQYITGIAATERSVYIADSGSRSIHRYAPDGDYVDAIGGMRIPKGNPACAGEPDPDHETEGFLIPSAYFDCAVDGKGILYVGHTGRHRIERYDGNNQLIGSWGKFGPAPEDFCGCCNPTNLALFADGRIATSEKGIPRLKVYDGGGKLLAYLGAEAFPGNAAGLDLAVDSHNRIALVEPIGGKIRFYELKSL